MTITLAKAMEERIAELLNELEPVRVCETVNEMGLIRDCFSEWLDVQLPEGAEICVGETSYPFPPGGYHVSIRLPAAEHIIFFRRTLFWHGGYLCIWPLSSNPLWKTRRSGRMKSFHNFIDAALYACGEATVDGEGNLKLRD